LKFELSFMDDPIEMLDGKYEETLLKSHEREEINFYITKETN